MTETRAIQRVTTPVGDPAWLVTGYDEVKATLHETRLGRAHRDPENASRMGRSALFGGPMGTDPEAEAVRHRAMRKQLSPAFSARKMEALRPRVRVIVDELLDTLLASPQPVNVHEVLSFPLPALVICELLGVPFADRDDFRRWSDEAADTVDEQRSRAGLGALWAYMSELVQRKRREPADDVVSDLIAGAEAAGEPIEGVAMLAAGLLFAGHETTVAAIDRGLVLLLSHLDQWEALCQDPTLVASAVEETLRCELPVVAASRADGGLPRYAATDLDIQGVTVPEGDMVLLGLRSANADEEQFAAPERFDITRTPNLHLTFGHGPRFCIGAPLARMELTEVFSALAARCPGLRLATPAGELQVQSERLVSGLTSLHLTWPVEDAGEGAHQ
ncbi:cytochrome P450 [Pseudonocardia sp. GCM10023141]|uniref:cytochrome P450 n=1 Tax=Pseudonocardia sp. GCM10023141 TaxID=3252653 RepID=UPI0036083C56